MVRPNCPNEDCRADLDKEPIKVDLYDNEGDKLKDAGYQWHCSHCFSTIVVPVDVLEGHEGRRVKKLKKKGEWEGQEEKT